MRKTYERDFKLKICQDIESGVASVGSIAKEYAVSRPIVSRWLAEYKRYGKKAFTGKGKRLPGKAEIYVLQKQVETLMQENEILKKFEQFVKKQKP